MRNKLLILLFLLISIFTLLSCNENTTNPKEEAGKRNYTWTYYNLGEMFSNDNWYQYLGGTGPDNVWISGDGELSKSVIHYDGNVFKLYDIHSFSSIPASVFSPQGSNSTWFAGKFNDVFKETNKSISFYQKLDSSSNSGIFIESFYGNNETGLFGAGAITDSISGTYLGCVWKLVNNKWIPVDTLIRNSTSFYEVRNGTKEGNILYLLSVSNLIQESITIYKYDFKNFIKIYSCESLSNTIPEILNIDGRVYFYINKQLLHYENNNFVVIKDFSNYEILLHKIFGKNLNDLFLPSKEGIYHYNGTDVQLLYNYPENGTLWRGLFFENDVFFLIRFIDKKHADLIHGKLNN